ncbi:uncharacterized protein LOC132617415 [Lycium barbarum]|uniref:uncharacterized protein LOC132617415 n=1 Tax=Lycium barbarum TaxID=112863 RepID=UPI00293E4AA3|nr:uncharacterized protein LOC132617415 [Lycium barbarum]
MDAKFDRVFDLIKGHQTFEKGADSEAPVHLPDADIHQPADDYLDHGDDIQMETDTGHVDSAIGDVPDIGVGHCNESGDTLKASTEEINDGGDLSGEPKSSAQFPCDVSRKDKDEGNHESDATRQDDSSNNSEGMIAQVLADIAASDIATQSVKEQDAGEHIDHIVSEKPYIAVTDAKPLSQWLLPDEFLPSQTPGKQVILHPSMSRATRPSRYKSSPYMTDFGSASGMYFIHIY